MSFDISTAKEVKKKFDLSTAREANTKGHIDPTEGLLMKTINALKTGAQGFSEFSDQAMGGFSENAMLSAPSLIQEKTGIKMLPDDPEAIAGHAGKFTGDVLGWTVGGPGMLGKAALSKLPKAFGLSSKLAPTLAKGALEMGAGRAGFIPSNVAKGEKLESELGDTALMSGFGAGTSLAGKALFKKQYAGESLKEGSGAVSNALDDAYGKLFPASDANIKLQSDPYPLYQLAKDAGKEAQGFSKRVPPIIRGWITKLGEYVDAGKTIPAREIEKLRAEAGEIFKLHPEFLTMKTMQKAIRMVGGAASKELKNLARKAGVKDFDFIMDEVSRSKALQVKPSLLHEAAKSGVAGAVAGGGAYMATGDPRASIGAGAAAAGVANPILRNALFKGIEKSGIGKATKAGVGVYSAKKDKD